MDESSVLSNTERQLTPPSSVFHTPPDAAPTYDTLGLPGSPATAIVRLPSGPMKRKRRFAKVLESNGCAEASTSRQQAVNSRQERNMISMGLVMSYFKCGL